MLVGIETWVRYGRELHDLPLLDTRHHASRDPSDLGGIPQIRARAKDLFHLSDDRHGRTFVHAVIRGTALAGAQSVIFTDTGFRGSRARMRAGTEPKRPEAKPADLVQVELSIPAEAKTGRPCFPADHPGRPDK